MRCVPPGLQSLHAMRTHGLRGMSATQLPDLLWRQSRCSKGTGQLPPSRHRYRMHTLVAVRDSNAPDAAGLIFSARAWRRFTDNIEPARKAR